jgi:hypothetical protein
VNTDDRINDAPKDPLGPAERPDPLTQIGDTIFLTLFGSPLPATVLAILDDRMLVEYEIGTYSALRIVSVDEPDGPHFRRISYHDVPRRWLEAIVGTGIGWIGAPRGCATRAPSPADLLARWDAGRET